MHNSVVRFAVVIRGEQPAQRPQLRHQSGHLGDPQDEVQLGYLALELSPVALHHAPYGDNRLHSSLLLQLAGAQERIYRLLLGRLDEATGVDHHDLGALDVAADPGTRPG